jgi:hypothetical protein
MIKPQLRHVPAFDFEIGKRGVEMQVNGRALFWIVTISFGLGVCVAIYICKKKQLFKRQD